MLLRQFEYLVALAREKHFARAAASLNVSQPSLSAGIRQLEQELGVLIVERGHRFTGFTAEGERVLERARRILAECGMLRSDVAQFRAGLAGSVRIGVIPTALAVVGTIIAPFTSRFPSVTVSVLSRSSIEIQRGLDEFDLDAAITYLDNEPLERVQPKPLYAETYSLLTHRGGPFSGRATVTWREAADL
ncbi:MAG: LysR family transcriptional regulator, partial [Beijerinckiaceae bacterium]